MTINFADDQPIALELMFSSTEESQEAKLADGSDVIWKDILPEGTIAMTPGTARPVPFEIVPQGESRIASDKITVSMSDLIESFEDQAFQDVTIPDGHPKKGDSALNNTGYVRALRVVKKGAKHVMQAGLGFTEPDVKGKVQRGTVPNVSAGVFLNFTRKLDKKKFRAALNHVALTKQPWISDLAPFKKVFASDDIEGDDSFEIMTAEFDESNDNSGGDTAKAEVVWDKTNSTQFVREEIRKALNPPINPEAPEPIQGRAYYDVLDMSRDDMALVEEYYKGNTSKFVVPYTFTESKVQIAPQARWQQVEEALIAASDESPFDKVLETLRAEMSDNVDDTEAEAERPAPPKETPQVKSVVLSDDPLMAEVQAARQRMRQAHPDLFANSH